MTNLPNIDPLPALKDNYIWVLYNGQHAVVVDPGEAHPVLAFLRERQLKLAAILVTHHHGDHTGGIAELREVYNVPVYAPRAENVSGATHAVYDGEVIEIGELGVKFTVLDIRGHTRGHVAYLGTDYVFCGDTLFGCGCGRVFEGTMAEMFRALQRLAQLPGDTRVYCAHEYTEANIRFGLACEPGNARLRERAASAAALRAAGKPTLPSTIALENATNPFLRCGEAEIIGSALQQGAAAADPLAVFTALRTWKNHFVA